MQDPNKQDIAAIIRSETMLTSVDPQEGEDEIHIIGE